MEKYDFISLFISEFFQNDGLRDFLVFLLGSFGVAIIYKVVMGLFHQKL